MTNQTPPPEGEHAESRHGRAEFEAQMRHNVAEVEAQMRAARAQFEAANDAVTARVGRNLVLAIGAGVGLGGLLVVSLIIVPWLFILFGAALVGFAAFELGSALRFAGRDVPRVASVVVGVAVMPAAFFLGVEGLWPAVVAAIVLVSLYRIGEFAVRRPRPAAGSLGADLVAGAFVQLYITLLGGLYVVLTAREGGVWWTLGTIVVVVSVDFGAWLAGVSFGKHPMAPTISPKKTWEGFAGAALASVLAGVLIAWLMLGIDWWVGVPFGLVILLVATGGDLVESLIKRDLGIKDISTWLPGHGGFLDRLDSILPSAAVGYAAFLIFAR